MKEAGLQVSLLVESDAVDNQPEPISPDAFPVDFHGQGSALRFETLALPPDEPAVVCPGPGDALTITSGKDHKQDALLVMESTRPPTGQAVRTIVLTPPCRRTRINGAAAPRVAVVKQGDEISFDDAPTIHVSILEKPFVGPAPAESNGLICPVDKAAIQPGQRVWQCPHCLSVVHHAEPGSPEAGEGYTCLKLCGGKCPVCSRPVRTEKALTWFPEG